MGKERNRGRDLSSWCARYRGRPQAQTPSPQEEIQKSHYTWLPWLLSEGKKKHHRDYKSSGIICEINMGAHGAKVRMRKRKEEEVQLLVEGENIRERDSCICFS